MRLLAAFLLVLADCTSSTCESPCPDDTVCIANRCRTPCVVASDCHEGEVCFRGYCEEGDLRPGASDSDALSGDAPGDPSYTCGNDRIDPGERCDGTDLGSGIDCTSFKWASGTLHCMVTCLAYDLSECVNPPGNCGSGTPTGQQQCDTANLRDESCESLGFSGGTLACNANCSFDVTGCVQ